MNSLKSYSRGTPETEKSPKTVYVLTTSAGLNVCPRDLTLIYLIKDKLKVTITGVEGR